MLYEVITGRDLADLPDATHEALEDRARIARELADLLDTLDGGAYRARALFGALAHAPSYNFV